MTAVTAIASLTSSLGNCFLTLIYNIGLLQDGLDLTTQIPDVADKQGAVPQKITSGQIEIRDMSFAYPSQSPVLKILI